MQPIESIDDLPFHERDALTLLNFRADESELDDDYYQYGYARIDVVNLIADGATEPLTQVRDALLLALHSADEPEYLTDDVELEFFVDEVADDYSVTVLLSDFLAHWLPRITGGERAIVLVLCNPHNAVLAAPLAAHGVPVYYPMGDDVQSWSDQDAYGVSVELIADAWRLA